MSNPFDLAGKVALVTGGNSGIGLGMAEALARAGADVAVWGSTPDKNARAAERLAAHGTTVHTAVIDEAAVERAMAATVEALGRLDACFANAGVAGFASSFMAMPTDE